jgi:hypothetical protein
MAPRALKQGMKTGMAKRQHDALNKVIRSLHNRAKKRAPKVKPIRGFIQQPKGIGPKYRSVRNAPILVNRKGLISAIISGVI